MNGNCFVGCGRLTRDAEFTTTKNGTPMSKFRLAINNRRNDETLFVNVLCFGKMAEALQPKLVKGRIAHIQGRLNIEDYEDGESNKRTSVCIMADEVELGYSPDRIIKNETVETE
jgi:single-strand DNA-binding protein